MMQHDAVNEAVTGEKYLTRREAADYLRLSLRTLDSLIAQPALPVIRLGSRVLLDRGDLDAFMAARKGGAV